MQKIIQASGLALALALAAAGAQAQDQRFCGGPVSQAGDQSLEFVATQPASLVVCMAGYELEKCGDHETAAKVYDKCIAAGYAGAMIRKAHMLESGASAKPSDLAAATELMHQLAVSGDSPYATLGKLHYARALQQGKGVAQNEMEARKWFEAAAKNGDPDAIAFLQTAR